MGDELCSHMGCKRRSDGVGCYIQYCKKHKETVVVDKCMYIDCDIVNSNHSFCRRHSEIDLFDNIHKSIVLPGYNNCIYFDCTQPAIFGYIDGPAVFCLEHKSDLMISVYTHSSEDCRQHNGNSQDTYKKCSICNINCYMLNRDGICSRCNISESSKMKITVAREYMRKRFYESPSLVKFLLPYCDARFNSINIGIVFALPTRYIIVYCDPDQRDNNEFALYNMFKVSDEFMPMSTITIMFNPNGYFGLKGRYAGSSILERHNELIKAIEYASTCELTFKKTIIRMYYDG